MSVNEKTALQGGFSKVLRATNSLSRGNWLKRSAVTKSVQAV